MWRKGCAIWWYKSLERWFDRSRERTRSRSFVPRSFLFEHYLDEETVERGWEGTVKDDWKVVASERGQRWFFPVSRSHRRFFFFFFSFFSTSRQLWWWWCSSLEKPGRKSGQRNAEEKRYCILHYRACEGTISRLYIGNSRSNRDVPEAKASHKGIPPLVSRLTRKPTATKYRGWTQQFSGDMIQVVQGGIVEERRILQFRGSISKRIIVTFQEMMLFVVQGCVEKERRILQFRRLISKRIIVRRNEKERGRRKERESRREG